MGVWVVKGKKELSLYDFKNLTESDALLWWRDELSKFNSNQRAIHLKLENIFDDIDQARTKSEKAESDKKADFTVVANTYAAEAGLLIKSFKLVPGGLAMITGYKGEFAFSRCMHTQMSFILKNRLLKQGYKYHKQMQEIFYRAACALTLLDETKVKSYFDTFVELQDRVEDDLSAIMKIGAKLKSSVSTSTKFTNAKLFAGNQKDYEQLEVCVKAFKDEQKERRDSAKSNVSKQDNCYIATAQVAIDTVNALMFVVVAHKLLLLMNTNLNHDMERFGILMAPNQSEIQASAKQGAEAKAIEEDSAKAEEKADNEAKQEAKEEADPSSKQERSDADGKKAKEGQDACEGNKDDTQAKASDGSSFKA